MARFRYDCSRPLGLVQRRQIAARLCHLIGTAIEPVDTPPADWDRFVSNIGALLRSVGTRGETGLDIAQTVEEVCTSCCNGHSSDIVLRSVQRIEHLKETAFVCQRCGRYEGGCVGDPLDARFFEDNGDDDDSPGGLCVGFMRKLTRGAYLSANFLYTPIAAPEEVSRVPEDFLLKLERCDDNRDATLPIDGRVEIEHGQAVITVSWPRKPDEVEQGITMLPWLLYHEVFVHVFQGLGREVPIGRVEANCVFTEGTVDAVARAVLKHHFLDTHFLPDELVPLRTRFHDETERYGKERCQPRPEDFDPSTRESMAAQFRRARARGTKIFETMTGLAHRYNKPVNWPANVVMRLNLDLSLEQRRAFARDFWELLDPSGNGFLDRSVGDELSTWFDNYLSGKGNVEELLAELPKIADSRFSQG